MERKEDIRALMQSQKLCVVMPTYNNLSTAADVAESVLEWCDELFVVVDGATDGTKEALELRVGERVHLIAYMPNRGKGYALRRGFEAAHRAGFEGAVTIDSDGQHLSPDIARFARAWEHERGALIVGSREFGVENMPSGNSFANRFSNFWFAVQTFHRLPDTQTGYRLYPLAEMCRMGQCTSRYEAELEMLVRAAWRGVKIVPMSVGVYYAPPKERVSHFRGGVDFARISVLNTVLTMLAVVWGWPQMALRGVGRLINGKAKNNR